MYITRRGQKRRGHVAQPVSRDDVKSAIKQLKGLGCGYGLFKIGVQHMVWHLSNSQLAATMPLSTWTSRPVRT